MPSLDKPQRDATISVLERAGLLRRLLSLSYEALLLAALLIIASIPFIVLFGSANSVLLKIAFRAYLLLVAGCYFVYCWTRGGQTLPMKTWRIRLVGASAEQVAVAQALGRFVLAAAGYALCAVTILWALFDSDRQFLHDRLAGTRIVRVG